jgi:type I restriction enzyme R subunit
VILHPAMANPTLVVLTDRNDLDDQLFGTFARCHGPACASRRCRPPTAPTCARKLAVASGGVVFTTIQKFFPEERGDRHPGALERRNIVVIADEAHRSQYDFIDGFARHMRDALPHASFVGFTGTPIEKTDANNARSVRRLHQRLRHPASRLRWSDGRPSTYESRLVPAGAEGIRAAKIDLDFEMRPEGEEVDRKRSSRASGATAAGGGRLRAPDQALARDLVEHYEKRCRRAMDGKAMVVVMMPPHRQSSFTASSPRCARLARRARDARACSRS